MEYTKQQKEKVSQFLNDLIMSETIYDILFSFFVKNHGEKDVYMLAARSMAVDLLPQAWNEVQKNRLQVENDPKQSGQIGL